MRFLFLRSIHYKLLLLLNSTFAISLVYGNDARVQSAGCGCLDHHDCGQIADRAASPGNLIQEVPLQQNIQDLQPALVPCKFPQVREIIDLQLCEREDASTSHPLYYDNTWIKI